MENNSEYDLMIDGKINPKINECIPLMDGLCNWEFYNRNYHQNHLILPGNPCYLCSNGNGSKETQFFLPTINNIEGYNKCTSCNRIYEITNIPPLECIWCHSLSERGFIPGIAMNYKYTLCKNCDMCKCRNCNEYIFINKETYTKIGDLCNKCLSSYNEMQKTKSLLDICLEIKEPISEKYTISDEYILKNPQFVNNKLNELHYYPIQYVDYKYAPHLTLLNLV